MLWHEQDNLLNLLKAEKMFAPLSVAITPLNLSMLKSSKIFLISSPILAYVFLAGNSLTHSIATFKLNLSQM